MAQATGTATVFSVGSAGGVREDLEDKIWDLFAEDTYALTNFPHIRGSNVYHEWLKDTLAAASSNSALEGNDPTYSTLANPSRVGNYMQISDKNFLVSATLEAVSKAGRAREAARQAMKKMRELRTIWSTTSFVTMLRWQAMSVPPVRRPAWNRGSQLMSW